jgi:hypothetical protein
MIAKKENAEAQSNELTVRFTITSLTNVRKKVKSTVQYYENHILQSCLYIFYSVLCYTRLVVIPI